jgi:hypothetical protein
MRPRGAFCRLDRAFARSSDALFEVLVHEPSLPSSSTNTAMGAGPLS